MYICRLVFFLVDGPNRLRASCARALSVCLCPPRYRYLVDLSQMTQTNVDHPNRKMRHIRRNPGKSLPNTPPGVGTGKV